MTNPTDNEICDRLVERGVLSKYSKQLYSPPDSTDLLDAEDALSDWRVAGAVITEAAKAGYTLLVFKNYDGGFTCSWTHPDRYGDHFHSADEATTAIIIAGLEALDDK